MGGVSTSTFAPTAGGRAPAGVRGSVDRRDNACMSAPESKHGNGKSVNEGRPMCCAEQKAGKMVWEFGKPFCRGGLRAMADAMLAMIGSRVAGNREQQASAALHGRRRRRSKELVGRAAHKAQSTTAAAARTASVGGVARSSAAPAGCKHTQYAWRDLCCTSRSE